MYDMPAEIDVRTDGALRIITLNRPDSLNSVNDALHVGLAHVWTRLGEDREARAHPRVSGRRLADGALR